MPFEDSYLGRLRQHVGNDLLLCPGAQVVVERSDGSVLMQSRADDGRWEIPAGASEPGQSFADTALVELAEETGIRATAADLVPFACLSDPAVHTLEYPNGDLVHAFAMCFLLHDDDATPRGTDGEAVDHGWFPPDALPAPLHGPTRTVLELLGEFRRSGCFQAR